MTGKSWPIASCCRRASAAEPHRDTLQDDFPNGRALAGGADLHLAVHGIGKFDSCTHIHWAKPKHSHQEKAVSFDLLVGHAVFRAVWSE
jgi:hypothetical protein